MPNARLIAARTQLGASQAKVAKAMRLDQKVLEAFEAASKTPIEEGDWTNEARKVAAFYGYPPSRFWPEAARRIRSRPPAGEPTMSPEAVVDAKKIYGFVQKAVQSLNDLDLDMLQAHYCRGATFEEIGKKRGLSGSRAREMFYKVLGKVRASVTSSYVRVQKTVHQDMNYHRWDAHPMMELPADLIIEAICETTGSPTVSASDALVQIAEEFARTSEQARVAEKTVANHALMKSEYGMVVGYEKKFPADHKIFAQKKLRNDRVRDVLAKAVKEYLDEGGKVAAIPSWPAEPYDVMRFYALRLARLKKKIRFDPVPSEQREARDALDEAAAQFVRAVVLAETAPSPSPLTAAATTIIAAGLQSLFTSRPKQSEQHLLGLKKIYRGISWVEKRGAPPMMAYSIRFNDPASTSTFAFYGTPLGWELVTTDSNFVTSRKSVSLAQAIQIASTAYTPHHAVEVKPSTIVIAKKMISV